MINKLRSSLAAVSISAFVLSGCAERENSSASATNSHEARTAIARLAPTEGNSASGTVTFIEDGDQIRIIADLTGVSGAHGFHVHENGDCSAPDASSAGGHFNPTGMPHAGPDAEQRHVGDLGNIEGDDDGTFHKEWTDEHLSFDGNTSIIGKAVVVHAGEDDLTSQPSGDAGARIACGVITLQ